MPKLLKGCDSSIADRDWKISNKALDMLQCFMSGIDNVVIRIALEEVRKKSPPGVVRIESMDIERAAKRVMDQIRSQNVEFGIPVSEIDVMDECLKAKKGPAS